MRSTQSGTTARRPAWHERLGEQRDFAHWHKDGCASTRASPLAGHPVLELILSGRTGRAPEARMSNLHQPESNPSPVAATSDSCCVGGPIGSTTTRHRPSPSWKSHPVATYVTMAEAADLAPGHPTSGTTWRWCRKGLTARDGSIIHLKHVRVGRQVYTTPQWLHEFFEAVATADQQHFLVRESLAAQAVKSAVAEPPARPVAPVDVTVASTPDRQDELDAALREEGL